MPPVLELPVWATALLQAWLWTPIHCSSQQTPSYCHSWSQSQLAKLVGGYPFKDMHAGSSSSLQDVFQSSVQALSVIHYINIIHLHDSQYSKFPKPCPNKSCPQVGESIWLLFWHPLSRTLVSNWLIFNLHAWHNKQLPGKGWGCITKFNQAAKFSLPGIGLHPLWVLRSRPRSLLQHYVP